MALTPQRGSGAQAQGMCMGVCKAWQHRPGSSPDKPHQGPKVALAHDQPAPAAMKNEAFWPMTAWCCPTALRLCCPACRPLHPPLGCNGPWCLAWSGCRRPARPAPWSVRASGGRRCQGGGRSGWARRLGPSPGHRRAAATVHRVLPMPPGGSAVRSAPGPGGPVPTQGVCRATASGLPPRPGPGARVGALFGPGAEGRECRLGGLAQKPAPGARAERSRCRAALPGRAPWPAALRHQGL